MPRVPPRRTCRQAQFVVRHPMPHARGLNRYVLVSHVPLVRLPDGPPQAMRHLIPASAARTAEFKPFLERPLMHPPQPDGNHSFDQRRLPALAASRYGFRPGPAVALPAPMCLAPWTRHSTAPARAAPRNQNSESLVSWSTGPLPRSGYATSRRRMGTTATRVISTSRSAPTSPRHPSVEGPTLAPYVLPPSANAVRPRAPTWRSSPVIWRRHSRLITTLDVPSNMLGS